MPKLKGMEAVAEKVGRKQPVFAKKGAKRPGVTIMVALGGPKKGPPPRPMEDEEEDDDYDLNASSQTDEIARLKARIAELEAKLAEYEGGEEDDTEDMEEED
jgi:hypothetical protein